MSAEEVGNVRSAGKDVSREPVGSNAKIVSEEFFHLHGYSFESAILNRFQCASCLKVPETLSSQRLGALNMINAYYSKKGI